MQEDVFLFFFHILYSCFYYQGIGKVTKILFLLKKNFWKFARIFARIFDPQMPGSFARISEKIAGILPGGFSLKKIWQAYCTYVRTKIIFVQAIVRTSLYEIFVQKMNFVRTYETCVSYGRTDNPLYDWQL